MPDVVQPWEGWKVAPKRGRFRANGMRAVSPGKVEFVKLSPTCQDFISLPTQIHWLPPYFQASVPPTKPENSVPPSLLSMVAATDYQFRMHKWRGKQPSGKASLFSTNTDTNAETLPIDRCVPFTE